MDKTQEAARRRLLKALEITGWKSTKLATEAGVAPSTINRFLNQDVGHTISLKTMAKVDAAVRAYLESRPFSPETIQHQIEYFKDAPDALEPTDSPMVTLHVRGAVQAGQWSEAMEWPADEWQRITLPRPDGHRAYFGLRVKGPSMNQVYPEGAILVCVPFHDYDHGLTEGDHVIVQRWEAGQVEATVKELRQSGDGGIWLWPRSDHPEHQTPIALPKNGKDHPEYEGSNEIRVVAVVVADYRIRSRSAQPQ